MVNDTWKSPYKGWKLVFYTATIGTPIVLILAVLILYLGGHWQDMYYFFFVLIPIVIVTDYIILKPIMEEAKYQLYRYYYHISVEWVSSCVQSALQDNKIQFTVTNNYVRKKLPFATYDFFYEASKDGFQLGIQKHPQDATVTRVLLS